MRILHLSKFYPPDSGGLERVVQNLAEGAASEGHTVRVVCAVRDAILTGSVAHPEVKNGVEVVRVPTYGMYWSQPAAPGYLAAARWRASVAYIHRPHPLADLASLRLRTPASIVFHHSDVQRQRMLRAAYQPLAHRVARNAAASVVASKYNLDHADDLGTVGRDRARVIPLGVDTNRFRPAEVPRPRVFPDRGGGPVGLFVGRLVAYKGLDVLVTAVQGTDLRIAIVGSGPMERELAGMIERFGLEQQVTLIGEVPEADLPSFYHAADYAVLPSTSAAEMFGMAALEAMACGKPVITTDIPSGVQDVNVPEETGLRVAPGDANSLRDAMTRIAGDDELRQRLGAAGRVRAVEPFSVGRMVAAHLALCEEILRGKA